MKLEFVDEFSKNNVSNFMKIRPVAAELFSADWGTDGLTDRRTDGLNDRRTDGRTDVTTLIVALRSFANACEMDLLWSRKMPWKPLRNRSN